MNKSIAVIASLVLLGACRQNQPEVKSPDTVIESRAATIMVNTDTVAGTERQELPEQPEVAEQPEVKAATAKAFNAGYAAFGDKIQADNALTKEQMYSKYVALKAGDSLDVKFKAKIKDVCQKKGCWMALELPGGKESFVRFKDYAFFVPLNATGQDAVVSGKAFVSEVPVSQLRHYAKDGGQSEAEIAKITKPKVTYGFLAAGVLISK